MSNNFGHVESMTESVGGKECNFRSKLEYRWAVWCQFRKEQGIIDEWWYEDPDSLLELRIGQYNNLRKYLPDFTIQIGEDFEFEETKGYFTPKDASKMRAAAEQYENPFTLIFANLNNTKSMRAQFNRARRLIPHLKRVIFDAKKTIFNKIPGIK